ncbi:hypothetical protein BDZ89DRAFT_804722 [Hymenopellis radicata]|nr:hypothetical protein BDZ89DRAFT_804722 [Hymenopellis radicata]
MLFGCCTYVFLVHKRRTNLALCDGGDKSPLAGCHRKENPRDSTTSLTSRSRRNEESNDEAEETLTTCLEAIGVHIRGSFNERCVDRVLSLARKLLLSETFWAVNFICKDNWSTCWNKPRTCGLIID